MFSSVSSRSLDLTLWRVFLGLIVLAWTSIATAADSPFFDYGRLRPSPQMVSHFNDGHALEVARNAAYTLLVTPDLKEDAAYIANRFAAVAGIKVKVTEDASLSRHGVGVAVLSAESGWRGPDVVPVTAARPGGYTLQIDPNGAFLVADDRVGAFYGLQTLVQAFALAVDSDEQLPAALVSDWPDLTNRAILLVVTKLRGGDDLTYLKRVLDALASLKYSSVFFEFSNALPGPKYPFPKLADNPLDEAKVAELCDYARSLHLEVNLAFQFGGHCAWLLQEPAYETLGEADKARFSWDNTNWSPKNEQLWPIIEDRVLHQIAVCKPARVHIAHDEMEFGEFNTSASSRAAGLSNEELLTYGINRLRQIIPAEIQVLIWFDLFMPEEMKRSHRVGFVSSHSMHELTPDDIEINLWLYGGGVEHVTAAAYLKQRSRKFWTSTFEPAGIERVAYFTKLLGGEGVIGTHWFEVDSKWTTPRNLSPKAMHAIVALGQHAWNSAPVGNLVEQDTVRLFRLLTAGTDATAPAPEGPGETVDLAAAANGDGDAARSQATWVTRLLGAIREGRGDAAPGLDRAVPGGGILLAGQESDAGTLPQKVTIPVGRTVSAVTFFHTANTPDAAAGLDVWSQAFAHPRIGAYTLVFEDGGTHEVALDYRWNIQDWNSLYGAYAARVAWAGVGEGGVRMQVQQTHWRSSDAGGRRLERIEVESDLRNGLNPLLLQVVTHGPDAAGHRADDDQSETVWADDFEYRSLRELQAAWSGIGRKFEQPGWKTSGAAAGEKAMLWELKPAGGKARHDVGFQREGLDFSGANELRFSARTLGGDDAEIRGFTCAVYLGNTKANYWYRYVFALPPRGAWETIRLPLSARFTEGKVPQEGGLSDLDTFMFSVWHQNKTPVAVLIDDLRVCRAEGAGAYKKVR